MRKRRLIVGIVSLAALVSACSEGVTGDWSGSAPTGPPVTSGPADSTSALQPPNAEPYDAVYFDNPGVNPFIDTEDDALSTFALDVDTGSYTIGRRFLSDGHLPDKDSVRVEEYVNYFEQDYPMPSVDEGLTLTVDGGTTPFTQNPRNQVVRIGVQAGDVAPEERSDANLTFVIDTSGSMEREDRLSLVKRSLELLVSALRPTDTIGIVEYGTHARVVLQPTSVGDEGTILRAIDSLRPSGSTNAAEGLRLGYGMADESFREGHINRVILLSDGVANTGAATDAQGILDLVSRDTERGLELVTVGFGMGNYNDVLMEQLANRGNGFYAYVDTLDEARRLFVEGLSGTLLTVAKDARIQVEFNAELVQSWRLVGFENRALADEDFSDDSVDAGEIGAGHTVTALYELKPFEGVGGDLGVVKLRWIDPGSGAARQIERGISTSALVAEFEAAAPRFQLDVVVAQYAEVLRESIWARQVGTSLSDLASWSDQMSLVLPEDDHVKEFAGLVRQAAAISS